MIKIMQISDFHYVENTSQKLMRKAVCDFIHKNKPNILLITGDIHNYGKDYEPFKQYLGDIMSEGNLKSTDIFIIPGNHDVDYDLSDKEYKNRRAYISHICAEVENDPDCYKDYRDDLSQCFKGFNGAVKDVLGTGCVFDTVHHYIWNKKINIITINTSLISDGRDHPQIIDGDNLADLNPCNGLPTIVMGHHEISDMYESHQSVLKHLMALWKVSFYTCGDRHINKQKLLDDVMCDNVKIPVIIAGKGSVENEDEYSDVSFLIYDIDDESQDVQINIYKWDNNNKIFDVANLDVGDKKLHFELRYSPKLQDVTKPKVSSSSGVEEICEATNNWSPPVLLGYVLIGTQGREGIKYVWRSGDAVFESIALNQKQIGDLRGNRDTTISTYATSVSSGCILKAMDYQCSFCASGNSSFKNLLSFQDIALQNIFMSVYDDDCECHAYLKENKREFSYTAQGEPGYSYSQVRQAIMLTEKILLEGKYEDFITRHIIYTCGVPEFLDELADDINNHIFKRPISLHFSLNAIGKIRRLIMPIDKKYSYYQMLQALKEFYTKTNGCTGKIGINLIAFNKYEYQGIKYTVDDTSIVEILNEIGNPEIFRIIVYDYYSEKIVEYNKGNEQIEKLYKAINEYGYDVKVCHCWGNRVKSAFGMLDSSVEGLSDLGLDGQRNYQKSIDLIEKYLQNKNDG